MFSHSYVEYGTIAPQAATALLDIVQLIVTTITTCTSNQKPLANKLMGIISFIRIQSYSFLYPDHGILCYVV